MDKNELLALGKRSCRYYAGRVARDLCVKKKVIPNFEIGEDEAAWTGPVNGREVIHIGLGLFDKYPDETEVCENSGDFHCEMRYLTGHECGHQKYTTMRAFGKCQDNGLHGFIEYAMKRATGKTMRFVKETDYYNAVRMLADKYNLHFNMQMLQNFVHFVANSIEDGRMERLVGNELWGFKEDAKICRAKRWMHSPIDDSYELDNPKDFLIVVLNQILSLATMGIWQKGFSTNLAGTKVEDFVRTLIPEIKAGVLSRSCSRGMQHAENLITALYPLMYDAVQLSETEQALMEFFQMIAAQALPDFSSDGQNHSTYSGDEKQDAEASNEDQSSGSGTGSFCIFEGEGSESQSGQEGQDENGSQKANGAASSEGDGSESGKSAEGEEKSSEEKGSGNQKNNTAESNDSESQSQTEVTSQPGGRSGSKGQKASEAGDADVLMVQAAMEDAAKSAETQNEICENSIQMSDAIEAKTPETLDGSMAVDNAGPMDDICDDFNEFERAYELTEDLPLFIQQECDLTRREYEQYFRSRRKPKRRNQKAGGLDTHQLSRLLRGDTDVYVKPGMDNSFSGCIEVRLDRSGSMEGNKMLCACEALARIEEILKGLVPLKITAFDRYNNTDVEIIKNWTESRKKNCTWNFLHYHRSGGGTPTTEALLTAERELLARNEQHKLLILLTDENSDYCGDNLQEAIRKIRRDGIQLCAIYFEDHMDENAKRSFCDLFDNVDAIACNPSEINRELLPVIQRFTRQ